MTVHVDNVADALIRLRALSRGHPIHPCSICDLGMAHHICTELNRLHDRMTELEAIAHRAADYLEADGRGKTADTIRTRIRDATDPAAA